MFHSSIKTVINHEYIIQEVKNYEILLTPSNVFAIFYLKKEFIIHERIANYQIIIIPFCSNSDKCIPKTMKYYTVICF